MLSARFIPPTNAALSTPENEQNQENASSPQASQVGPSRIFTSQPLEILLQAFDSHGQLVEPHQRKRQRFTPDRRQQVAECTHGLSALAAMTHSNSPTFPYAHSPLGTGFPGHIADELKFELCYKNERIGRAKAAIETFEREFRGPSPFCANYPTSSCASDSLGSLFSKHTLDTLETDVSSEDCASVGQGKAAIRNFESDFHPPTPFSDIFSTTSCTLDYLGSQFSKQTLDTLETDASSDYTSADQEKLAIDISDGIIHAPFDASKQAELSEFLPSQEHEPTTAFPIRVPVPAGEGTPWSVFDGEPRTQPLRRPQGFRTNGRHHPYQNENRVSGQTQAGQTQGLSSSPIGQTITSGPRSDVFETLSIPPVSLSTIDHAHNSFEAYNNQPIQPQGRLQNLSLPDSDGLTRPAHENPWYIPDVAHINSHANPTPDHIYLERTYGFPGPILSHRQNEIHQGIMPQWEPATDLWTHQSYQTMVPEMPLQRSWTQNRPDLTSEVNFGDFISWPSDVGSPEALSLDLTLQPSLPRSPLEDNLLWPAHISWSVVSTQPTSDINNPACDLHNQQSSVASSHTISISNGYHSEFEAPLTGSNLPYEPDPGASQPFLFGDLSSSEKTITDLTSAEPSLSLGPGSLSDYPSSYLLQIRHRPSRSLTRTSVPIPKVSSDLWWHFYRDIPPWVNQGEEA